MQTRARNNNTICETCWPKVKRGSAHVYVYARVRACVINHQPSNSLCFSYIIIHMLLMKFGHHRLSTLMCAYLCD